MFSGFTLIMIMVAGDVMGPALSNLQDLLRMPYGCGEQNMASFAPNIFALQYLYNTNQETQAIVDEAKRYMRVGWYCVHACKILYIFCW